MACATCHVIVRSEWFSLLNPASEGEERLLDVVPGARETSRLACQIRLRQELDGLIVRLPVAPQPT
jgi:2Fe-2S ferredoxin